MLELLNQNSGVFSLLFAAIVAISTVVYALLTWRLVTETKRMRKVQTEPLISIILQLRDDFDTAIDLVIKNIGMGSANDLKFKINSELVDYAGRSISDRNIIKNGIEYLEPGQSFRTTVGVLTDYHNKYKDRNFSIEVDYKNQLGDSFSNTYILDFSEFIDLYELIDNPQKKIAKSIENIERSLIPVLTNSRRLQTAIYTKDDRKEEYARRREREKELIRENKSKS